jgi:hypothetical protein
LVESAGGTTHSHAPFTVCSHLDRRNSWNWSYASGCRAQRSELVMSKHLAEKAGNGSSCAGTCR